MFRQEETCTGRYGDIIPCDDTERDYCTMKDSIIRQGHNFVEINDSIAEGFNSADLLAGRHCQVQIEYLTYWLGHKIEAERPWRSRFTKHILPNLELDEHSVDKFEDVCRLVFLTLFINKLPPGPIVYHPSVPMRALSSAYQFENCLTSIYNPSSYL